MKNPIIIKTVLSVVFLYGSLSISKAQNANIPSEVTSIVNMSLEDGQSKLSSLGYEICHSSFLGKSQDWFNESTNNCITLKFDKKSKQITEVVNNPAIAECKQGLEAARKVWENYHDGQAPASLAKIDQERKKLSDQGYLVSYWINEVSPGRCSEYWINDNLKRTMFIVWEKQGNVWVKTDQTEYSMGKNPSPIK